MSLTGEGRSLSGKPVQPRRVALLALLAVHPHHTLSRDKLLAFLWPESPEEQGRHRLSESLYVLRKALGEEALISDGDQVRLDPVRLECDVVSFRSAVREEDPEAAVALYAGPFLDGFFLKDSGEFQRWVESERQSLAQDFGRAMETLAAAADRSGDPVEAVGWWSRLAAHDPYNSRFALGLMQALARAGDPGNAIQYAQEHAQVLREELGAEAPLDILASAESLRNGHEPWAFGGGNGRESNSLGEGNGAAAVPRDQATALPVEPTALVRGAEGVPEPRPHARGAPKRFGWAAAAALLVTVLGAGTVFSLTRDPVPTRIPNLVIVPPLQNQTGDAELDEAATLAGFWVEEALQRVEGVQLAPSALAGQTPLGANGGGSTNPFQALAERTNAGLAVNGIIRRTGDSLEFRVEVIDLTRAKREQHFVESGRKDALPGVLDRVARRVSGAVAFEIDPMMREIDGAYQPLPFPPTIEAFREHRLGYQATDQGDAAEAFRHHLAAYALDTILVRAVVAAGYMTADYHLKDSLARFADERRHLLSRRGQLDLALLTAMVASDHEGALPAVRELARLEGGGYSSIAQAFFAMRVNLPGEALGALAVYDPDLEWRRNESHSYWESKPQALHMLGRLEESLAEAREGRGRFPTHFSILVSEVRAASALGRVEEVSSLLLEARTLSRGHDSVAVVAGVELRAHGHMDAATEVFHRAAGWLREDLLEDPGNSTTRWYLARALYGAEEWAEARELAEALLAEKPESLAALGLVGRTEARLGDTAHARETMERLSGMAHPYKPGENLYQMASIAAVLGRDDEAMRLLYQAYAAGVPHGLRLHQAMDFEALRARDDFIALVTPKG